MKQMRRISPYLSLFGFLAATLWLGMATAQGQSVDLPLGHWGYDLLDRLEVKGLFTMAGFYDRPLAREDVQSILQVIEANKERLTSVERGLFEELKGEFAFELAATNLDILPEEQQPFLFHRHQSNRSLFVQNTLLEQTALLGPGLPAAGEVATQTRFGLRARATWGDRWAASLRPSLVLSMRSKALTPAAYYDRGLTPPLLDMVPRGANLEVAGELVLRTFSWLSFEFERDRVQWGPGSRSHLALSTYAPIYNRIGLIARFSKFRFSYFHGFLESDIGRKYIAAHRLEALPKPWLQLTFGEVMIYGLRGLEPWYLNPVTIFYFAEPHVSNADNRTIVLDMTLRPNPGYKFYLEWFIDDWSIDSLERFFSATRFYGNRFSLLLGGLVLDPCGWSNSEVRLEYVRVEPFTYVHRDPINVYKHADRSLGSFFQPNSDSILLGVSHQPNRKLKWGFSWQFTRHGEGDIDGPEKPPTGTRKTFLGGIIERTYSVTARFAYEFLRRQFIGVSYTGYRIVNQDRIPDQTNQGQQLVFSLNLVY